MSDYRDRVREVLEELDGHDSTHHNPISYATEEIVKLVVESVGPEYRLDNTELPYWKRYKLKGIQKTRNELRAEIKSKWEAV